MNKCFAGHLTKMLLFSLCIFFSTILLAQQTITSFTPTSGPAGTTITITGTGYVTTLTGNLVYFGTIKATVTAITPTSITVTVPVGAGFGIISVTTGFFTAYSAQPFLETFPGGGGFTPNSFAPKIDIATSANPYSVSTGDLDGDGKPDIVVVNTSANTVSVFLNTSTPGNISFAPKVDFATGNSPHRVCIADLTGDGLPELIVTNYADNTISIIKNISKPGTLSFIPKTDFATGANPESVAVGDIDGDSKPDLVVTNSGTTSITILQNAPGTVASLAYVTAITISYGGSPMGVAIGDLDGDGKPEIVTTNVATNNLAVFRNTSTPGNFSFAVHVPLSSFVSPQSVSIADLDGDGKPELIAGGNQTIAVLKNTCTPGNISFSAAGAVSSSPDDYATIADLDGDGKPDIVASAQFSNAATVLANITTGGALLIDTNRFYPSGNNPTCISVADFDGDGKPDIVLSNVTTSTVSILRNQANVPYITSFTPVGACPVAGSTVLINGSGFTGATAVTFGGTSVSFGVVSDSVISVLAAGPITGSITVTTASGTGTFAVPPPAITSFSPSSASPGTTVTISGKYFCGTTSVSFGGVAVTAFTVNADSSISAIVGTGASGNLNITTAAGTSALAGFTFIPVPVITSFSPTSGSVGTRVTIKGKNFSSLAANDIVYFGAVQAKVISASDSIVIVSAPTGANYQSVSLTNKDHNLSAYTARPFITTFGTVGGIDSSSFKIKQNVAVTDQFPVVSSISDLDGDGLPDLAIANFVTGSAAVIRNTSSNNNLSFATKTSYQVGNANSQTKSINTVDFDGDGKPDLAVVNEMDTNISILRNTGSAGQVSFASPFVLATGYESGPTFLATGDFDGDGKPDIAVLNTAGGRIALFRNTSVPGIISFAAPTFPNALAQNILSSISIADFDGDGKPDITVTDANNDLVYVYQNQSKPGIISFAPLTNYPAGFGANSIVTGDIDGDGLMDIMFSNPGNSSFSIMRNTSTPGNISFSPKVDVALATGTVSLAADNIALGDVDGDGKVDICLTTATTVMLFRNISNAGNITLSPPVTFNMPAGYNANYVSVDDLNSDGKPDLAVISQNSTNVTVFLNSIDSASMPVIISFAPTAGGDGDTITIKGVHFTGATAVSFGGVPATSYQVISDSVIVGIVGQGATGNVGVTTAGGTAKSPGFVFSGPKIISFTPTSAAVGTTVTITGKNFTGTSLVSFGGTAAGSFIVVSDSVITAVVGPGSTGNVKVTSASGSDSLAGFVFINPSSPPLVTSFTPTSGTTGTTVTITGKNFSGTTSVFFGQVPAASFTVTTDSTITAIVGAGATGGVLVISPSGYDSLAGFTYINPSLPPVISSFTPGSGSTGQIITITGHHFEGTTSVTFGGTAASSFIVLTDSTISATVGSGASGSVQVTTTVGTDSLAGFTYIPASLPQPPVIQSFTPASGATGQTITIKGLHFTGTNAVRFGNANAASFTVASDSIITAIVGAGATGFVYVSTSAGADSLAGFTYITAPAPIIQSFAPGSAKTGTTVTITGQYFTGATSVSFGGTPAASFTVVSDSSITAVVANGTSGAVDVTTPDGTGSLAGFIYLSDSLPPTIISFTPTSGNTGTTVIISGTNFTGTTAVSFGGTDATSFTVLADSVIIAVVGPGASGDVSVTTPAGTVSLSGFVFTKGLTAYPNPATSYVIVNFPITPTASQVTLMDMTGRLLLSVAINPDTGSVTLNISGLKPGVYIISWGNGTTTLRTTLLVE